MICHTSWISKRFFVFLWDPLSTLLRMISVSKLLKFCGNSRARWSKNLERVKLRDWEVALSDLRSKIWEGESSEREKVIGEASPIKEKVWADKSVYIEVLQAAMPWLGFSSCCCPALPPGALRGSPITSPGLSTTWIQTTFLSDQTQNTLVHIHISQAVMSYKFSKSSWKLNLIADTRRVWTRSTRFATASRSNTAKNSLGRSSCAGNHFDKFLFNLDLCLGNYLWHEIFHFKWFAAELRQFCNSASAAEE